MKKVVTSNDHVSLSKIEEALHSKNIFFYSKDEGAEEFLKIYSGMSYLGSDIYVSEADYEEAKRIVDAINIPWLWDAVYIACIIIGIVLNFVSTCFFGL